MFQIFPSTQTEQNLGHFNEGHTNFTVDVLGPTDHVPDYYEKCKAHIEELGLQDNIVLRGTVQVREVLHHYDALILSSFNEGQPIVVLEAMACGLPIIGTRVGGMDELVELDLEGLDACGSLVEPGDVKGLAAGTAALMNSPERYVEWSQNSLDRLRSTFLMHMIMQRYNALYRRLGAGIHDANTANDSTVNSTANNKHQTAMGLPANRGHVVKLLRG